MWEASRDWMQWTVTSKVLQKALLLAAVFASMSFNSLGYSQNVVSFLPPPTCKHICPSLFCNLSLLGCCHGDRIWVAKSRRAHGILALKLSSLELNATEERFSFGSCLDWNCGDGNGSLQASGLIFPPYCPWDFFSKLPSPSPPSGVCLIGPDDGKSGFCFVTSILPFIMWKSRLPLASILWKYLQHDSKIPSWHKNVAFLCFGLWKMRRSFES